MNIYLIRHAQSMNNHLWGIHGSDILRQEDPELSDIGFLQARLLANYLAMSNLEYEDQFDGQNRRGFFLTHLYASPMVRSVATAVVIGRQIGLQPIMHLEIFEGGGIYKTNLESGLREGLDGKNRAYYLESFPDILLPDNLQEEGWWSRPFEQRDERRPRARRVVSWLMEQHGGFDDNVGLITHVGFYNHLMRELFDIPDEAKVWFRLDNAAITRITVDENETRLVYANKLEHLPKQMVT